MESTSKRAHQQIPKVGVIITNLGSPDAPTKSALKRYLGEFLADPRVVEVPRLVWAFVLQVILLIRPARSARTYAKIWTEQGSPLVSITRALSLKLAKSFKASTPKNLVVVDFAMRYGNPSMPKVVNQMLEQGVEQLIVLPLYPQYSASTTASTFDKLAQILMAKRWQPALDMLGSYHDHPVYIKAIAASIAQFWEQQPVPDPATTKHVLLFSYHGIPKRYLFNGDPYHCQCLKTSRLISEALELTKNQCLTSFQSRFGREPWLEPVTDITLERLAKAGYQRVDVICPGFSIDCLETLEEIQMEAQQTFIDAGGQELNYIPCLNDSDAQLELLHALLAPRIELGLQAMQARQQTHMSTEQIEAEVQKSPNKPEAS